MSTDRVRQQLDDLVARRSFAEFLRSMSGCEVLHGFLLARSKSLVLLQVVREFHLDGYSLLRVKDLDEIQCRREEKFFQKILQAEGVTPGARVEPKVSLSGISAALKSLARTQCLVAVECEVEDDEQFFAGIVTAATGTKIEMRTFDVLGKWDPEPETIDTGAISLVSWDTEYLRVFAKHLK
jgi:hypothetical protein